MPNSAGKGDKWRKGFDFSKYWTNFSEISGAQQTQATKVKKKGSKTTYTFK